MKNPFSRFTKRKASFLLNFSVNILFVVLSIGLVFYVWQQNRKLALIEAEEKARLLLDHNLAIHKYFSEELIPHLSSVLIPIKGKDYFDSTWMSSTYAVRQIFKYFHEFNPNTYYYKEGAINARSPENEADADENKYLQELNSKNAPLIFSTLKTEKGHPKFITMRQGEVLEKSCMRCHSTPAQAPQQLVQQYGPQRSFHRKEGEVISAVSIRVPLDTAYAHANEISKNLMISVAIFLVIFLTLQRWIQNRLVFKPLSRMRAKAVEISQHPEALGEKIPDGMGKEMQDLALAFNQMSGKLREERNKLEDRVSERTHEIEKLHHERQMDMLEKLRSQDEKQRLKMQLFHSSKLAAVGTLAAGVAHEVNNPLAIINGNVELMKNKIKYGKAKPDQLIELLERQEKAVLRISQIVNGLRTFARSDRVQNEMFDFHRLLEETLYLVDPIYRKDQIRFKMHLKSKHPLIHGNPGRLQQVLLNLFSNAKDALLQSSENKSHRFIQVETSDDNQMIQIQITDNGCGMSAEHLERIFEPFYTTKPVGTGTGLGLSITHAIITEMGGTIEVSSKLNEGSTFTIKIPTHTAPIHTTSHQNLTSNTLSTPNPNHSVLQPLHGSALVVDDEEEIRTILKEYLHLFGIKAQLASDGLEALELLKDHPFDYVLTDLKMPKMSGIELIHEAKKMGHLHCKFILITGSLGVNTPEVKPGNLDHIKSYLILNKPFSLNSLYEKMVIAQKNSIKQTTETRTFDKNQDTISSELTT